MRGPGWAGPRRAAAATTLLTALLAVALPAAAQQPTSAERAPGHVTLEEAMAAARRSAPMAAAARARSQAAGARVGEARSDLLPQLGAAASNVTRSFNVHSFGFELPTAPGSPPPPDRIGPFANQDARLTGQMTLFDASAWARLSAAREGRVAAASEARAALSNASLLAAQAYLGLARAEALLRARGADTLLARQLADIAAQQKEAGVATGIDVTRAGVRLAAARTAYTEARGGVERARVALLRAMGAPLGGVVTVDSLAVPAETLPADADSLVSAALANRPELQAALRHVAAAEAGRRAARLGLLPTLSAAADYGYNGRRLSDAITTQSVALQLNWSAWDGGRRLAQEDERTAQVREAEALEREQRLAVEADARDAAAALETSRSALSTTRDRLDLAQQELQQAEERYREGLSGSLDVITAEEGLVEARSAYVDALYAANAADVAARRAAGLLASN